MDEIEAALAEEREQEARERSEAERRSRQLGNLLAPIVGLVFLGGVGWLAYTFFLSDRVPAWMCFAIAAVAIPLAVVRALVRALVRKGTERW